MKKKIASLITIILLANWSNTVCAQLYQVDINEKTAHSSLIAEGKVITQKSFWDPAHTLIYTANTIELYKSFKGQAPAATIEVLTQGGVVGNEAIEVSDLAQLSVGEKGVFFLYPNTINLRSPVSNALLYDIYSSDQGLMRYNVLQNKAACPFDEYTGISTTLYSKLQSLAGRQYTTINTQFDIDAEIVASHVNRIQSGTITATSPAIVTAGALLDPATNVLTISGTGLGTLANADTLLFKNGNTGDVSPTYAVPYNSPYIISWVDTEIKVRVPSTAASGRFGVLFSPGDTAFAPQPLNVSYGVLNATFPAPYGLQEPRLTAMNGAGGYSIVYSTATAGGGVDITASPIYNTFRRALTTWKEIAGVNFVEAGNTTSQAVVPGDGINIIMLDNTNTGVAVLPAGTLAITYSGFTICNSPSNAVAQKRGFDVVIRNQGVSAGTTVFENGPCPPAFVNPGAIDMETVILHELGHALNLAHVNDPIQISASYAFANYLNPASLMHYAVSNFVARRTPDASAYNGSQYTIIPRGLTLGTCLATTEMTPLTTSVPANDNCPLAFPTSPTLIGSVYNIDLVHATSNKAVDPQFTAVSCTQPVSVTNNVYQAIQTSFAGTLALTVTNYTTTPAEVAATCDTNQGVRVAVYAVNTCPAGQAFPVPAACLTITGNGALPVLTGLQANRNYLLMFEGRRNTKATFTLTLAGTALPIHLISFTGKNINSNTNELAIKIAEAVNVQSVDIERSADGVSFTSIGQLPKIRNVYNGSHTFTDANVLKGKNYYRLKITDVDGKVQYSDMVLLTVADKATISLQPNPFYSFISIKAQTSGKLTVVISDVVSKKLSQTTFSTSTQIVTASLAKGTYLVAVYDADGQLLTAKKMLKN